MAAKPFAIIAGVGAGTGRAVALRFARAYPVVLMARRPESYNDVVAEIRSTGGTALGVTADTSDPTSIADALDKAKAQLPAGATLAAAVFNVGASFIVKPFLDLKPEDLSGSLAANAHGLFNFAQKTMPLLLETTDAFASSPSGAEPSSQQQHPPTLIVTGATASLRGASRFAAFSAAKFAARAMTQSLAREFGPRGVHVAHVLLDGLIDTAGTAGIVANDGKPDGKISPEAIAESYWYLHTQTRSAFTQELDLRPYMEKF